MNVRYFPDTDTLLVNFSDRKIAAAADTENQQGLAPRWRNHDQVDRHVAGRGGRELRIVAQRIPRLVEGIHQRTAENLGSVVIAVLRPRCGTDAATGS